MEHNQIGLAQTLTGPAKRFRARHESVPTWWTERRYWALPRYQAEQAKLRLQPLSGARSSFTNTGISLLLYCYTRSLPMVYPSLYPRRRKLVSASYPILLFMHIAHVSVNNIRLTPQHQ